MDRYDALLENLKLTQRHGLEAVANRLNDFVAQLEGLVDAMKASVQDALPADPNELFPIAEVEAGLAELNVAADAAAAAADVPRPSAGVSLESLRLLDGAKSQSELLRALLPLLGEHVGRALVLVIRDGVVTAWSGSGFENAEAIRSWSGGIAASPRFSQLVETGMPLMVDPQSDPLLSEWLADQGVPAEGALLPISLRGKLMGIVYVDHDGDQPWALDAAQAHIATACLLIDTLHNRTDAPSLMLADIAPLPRSPAGFTSQEVFDTVTEPEPEPAAAEFDQGEGSAFEPATVAPSFEAAHDPVAEVAAKPVVEEAAAVEAEEVVEVDYDFEPEPVQAEPAGEAFDPSATMRVEVAEEVAEHDFQPPAQESSTPPLVADPQPVEPPPVYESEAPPPVRPIEPPVQATPAAASLEGPAVDDPRHEEARRFARLLVSEIKLYNEEEVDRGRAEKDLARRLKDDIDRSREMFEKRIPVEIRTGHDYFQEELVRILADGNPDVLGG